MLIYLNSQESISFHLSLGYLCQLFVSGPTHLNVPANVKGFLSQATQTRVCHPFPRIRKARGTNGAVASDPQLPERSCAFHLLSDDWRLLIERSGYG